MGLKNLMSLLLQFSEVQNKLNCFVGLCFSKLGGDAAYILI